MAAVIAAGVVMLAVFVVGILYRKTQKPTKTNSGIGIENEGADA